MASQIRNEISKSNTDGVLKKRKFRRKVFINKELHHIIYINRPANTCLTWNYIQNKEMTYIYKDMKKFSEKAFTIGEAAKAIKRHPDRIRVAIANGKLPKPQQSGPKGKYYFSPSDIEEIRKAFLEIHRGRPRKDGIIKTQKGTPTKEELEAILGTREMLYVKNEKGEFIPVWQSPDFS
jgi:hypothetical protein